MSEGDFTVVPTSSDSAFSKPGKLSVGIPTRLSATNVLGGLNLVKPFVCAGRLNPRVLCERVWCARNGRGPPGYLLHLQCLLLPTL